MKWDPELEDVPVDPPDGGGNVRAADKAHKSEIKARTHGFAIDWLTRSVRGHLASSREGPADRTFVDIGHLQSRNLGARGEVDLESGNAELNAIDTTTRASLLHGEIDVGHAMVHETVRTQFVAPGPFAARIGDPTFHGTPLGPGIGSPNVLIGGKPAFRALVDFAICGQATPAPHVGGVVASGASTVLVNGLPLVRAGDCVLELLGGPNPVAMGCPTVMAGPPAGASEVAVDDVQEVQAGLTVGDWFELRPSEPIVVDGLALDVGAKAGLKGNAKRGEVDARVKAEVMGSVARVQGGATLRIRLPLVGSVLEIRGRGSAAFACAGGEGELSVGVDEGRRDLKFSPPLVGAKPVCTDAELGFTFEDA